jgi:hypothetical protein
MLCTFTFFSDLPLRRSTDYSASFYFPCFKKASRHIASNMFSGATALRSQPALKQAAGE